MSLNHNKYLKTSEQPQAEQHRVPAKFYSGTLEQQVKDIRRDLDILKGSVDTLNSAFEKLLDMYEREHGFTHDLESGEITQLPPKANSRYIQ